MNYKTILIIAIILLSLTLIQIGTAIYFLASGYDVDCDIFSCDFTKTTLTKHLYDDCYYNGRAINCTLIDNYILKNMTGD